jgi:cell division protein FtsQ
LGQIFGAKKNRRTRANAPAATEPTGPGARMLLRALACMAIAAGLGGGAVGLRALLLTSPRFALTEVKVSATRHLDADRLAERGGLQLGRSLFALDLAAAERKIAAEPWVESVRVRRALPHAITIDVVEREARLGVALGAIYLVDGSGAIFKRARSEELAGLPVVTGLSRERYLADPPRARAMLRRALDLDSSWRAHGGLPGVGELHHDGGQDLAASFTVYFPHGGRSVAVRIGAPDTTLTDRLRRLEVVLAALDRSGEVAQLIHLDQRVQIDRVAVRLADSNQKDVAPNAGDGTEAL